MVMTSLSGHMMTLDFTASHQKWYGKRLRQGCNSLFAIMQHSLHSYTL